jgi:pimeloyl-ACP methyl ester carboxylesterase
LRIAPAEASSVVRGIVSIWIAAWVVALVFWMMGCAAPRVSERIQTASGVAESGALVERRFATRWFDLVGYWRPASRPGAGLRVYLEGDGLAWETGRRASRDPTPVDPVALRLAAADPSGRAILYLARPCQYTQDSNPNCKDSEWTYRRYSAESADAVSEAIDQLLDAELEARDFELVGYSGGGVVAANVAARRSGVSLLVTVAAPLDVAAWVAHHAVWPLTGSLDPAAQGEILRGVPQLHVVGARDEVVPGRLIRSYLAALGDPPTARMIKIPDFDHHCCWAQAWPELAAELTSSSAARRFRD